MAVVALLLIAAAGLAPAAWQCETPHFLVLSETDSGAAREAATYLESVRHRYEQIQLTAPQKAGRVVVLVFSGPQSLHPYLPRDSRDPSSVGGVALRGLEQDWIGIVWDPGRNPRTALAHEYAHLLHGGNAEPLWFREGFSEYLSTLVETDGATIGPKARNHLQSLAGVPWIGWDQLLKADALSPVFADPTFYGQAWLAVSWLASRGYAPDAMNAEALQNLLAGRSSLEIQSELENFWLKLWQTASPVRESPEAADETPNVPEVRAAAGWALPFWKAEFQRELSQWDEAQSSLEVLEAEFPERPEPTESLGAIALSRGDYDLAEEKLRIAILKGSSKPLTHHRYSLMLLRPSEEHDSASAQQRSLLAYTGVSIPYSPDRVGRAIWHARFAREANPDEPRFVLGEVQALSVAGEWDAAAGLLSHLQKFPEWGDRADAEFAELMRRRSQIVRSVDLPALRNELSPAMAASWMSANLPVVPRPAIAPKPPLVWPPPGTVLLYGYIHGVECRDRDKIVRVRTPRFTVELVEKAGSPAKLHNPPRRITRLSCGMSGFEVNVVYRPLPAGSAAKGELVAVVF